MESSFKRQERDKESTVSENKDTTQQAVRGKRRSFYDSSNLLYSRLVFLICLITSLGLAICSPLFRVKVPDYGAEIVNFNLSPIKSLNLCRFC
jgi:hypothetical protein